jgi:chlorite dismutase
MNPLPYHHYFFFSIEKSFYALSAQKQEEIKNTFKTLLVRERSSLIVPYATLGFKLHTTFMLWCRSASPAENQDILREILKNPLGQYLALTYNYFGIERASPYSGRAGKPK